MCNNRAHVQKNIRYMVTETLCWIIYDCNPICIMFLLILKGFIFMGGWKFTHKDYIFEIYVLRRIKWAIFCIKTWSIFFMLKKQFFHTCFFSIFLFELMKSHAKSLIIWQWEIWNFMGLKLKKWNICKKWHYFWNRL